MRALRAIANQLAGLPGRKNLIWVSGGFPVPVGAINGSVMKEATHGLAGDTRSTWRVFTDSGLAIYPVDARGLIGMAEWNPTFHSRTMSNVFMGEQPQDGRAEQDIRS